MQYYDAKIRLAGSTMNEVRKTVTAPELLVMQFLHGTDAITDLVPAKKEQLNLTKEKDRLREVYDSALKKREQSIDGIFGALGVIPTDLPAEMLEHYGIFAECDSDDIVDVARTATKKAKQSTTGRHEPRTQLEAERQERITPPEQVNLHQLVG